MTSPNLAGDTPGEAVGLCGIALPWMAPSHLSHGLWQRVHPRIWGHLGTNIGPCPCPLHPAPPQHPSPGTGVSPVPAVPCHCSGSSLELPSPGYGMRSASSLCSPQVLLSHQRAPFISENCLSLTLIKP